MVALVAPPRVSARPAQDPPPASTYPACQAQTYPLPDGVWSRTLISGPDGALWFPLHDPLEDGTNLGRFDPATATYSWVAVPDVGTITRLAVGPDGALWMTGRAGTHGDSIARFDPSTSESTDHPTPTTGAHPIFITTGPDGAIWFTESNAGQVGRLDLATGAITEYPAPKPASSLLTGIAIGADGNLWVSDAGNNSILRVNSSSGAMRSYPLPIGASAPGLEGSDPGPIIAGFDGALWFTQDYAQSIGRLEPFTGQITELPAGVTPVALTAGSDAGVWFADALGEGIGRLDAGSGQVSECSVGYESEEAWGITTGSDGNIWFMETSAGNGGIYAIGRIVVPRTLSATGSFVTAAYCDFLGRAPTPAERSAAVTQLDRSSVTRAAFLGGLAASQAWIDRIVTRFYQDTLGRDPDAEGLQYWANEIATGHRSVAEVAGELYASDEYYRGLGGGTDTSWVADLYQKILHRSADQDGLRYWVSQVAMRGRGWVAFNLYQSGESRSDRVTQLYGALLHRAPDGDGLAYWTVQILTRGDLVLAVDLAASEEYVSLAVDRFR